MTVDEAFIQLLQQQNLPLYVLLIIYLYMKFNDISTRLTKLETKVSMIQNYFMDQGGGNSNEEAKR